MKMNIHKKFHQWWKVRNWGVEENMDFYTQKRIILSNQLSILLVLVGVIYWLALWISGEVASLERFFFVELTIFLFVPIFNRLKKNNFTPIFINVTFPILTIISSIASKVIYPEEVNIMQYLAPRFILLAAAILPLVMLNPQKKRFFWIGLLVPALVLLFFDFWHWLAGVSVSQAKVEIPHYFVINIVNTVAFVLITSTFLLLHRVTRRYEERLHDLVLEVNQNNYSLVAKQHEISEAYEELKASQLAIEEQSKEISEQKEAIKQYNDELIEKNEVLDLHSNVLLRLARSKNVQLGKKMKAFQELSEVSSNALNLSRVEIWEYDEYNKKINCLTLFDKDDLKHQLPEPIVLTDFPAYYNAIKREITIKAENVSTNIHTHELYENYFKKHSVLASLEMPYFVNGQLLGLISFSQKRKERKWTAEDINFITSIAETMTVVHETYERRQALEQIKQQKEEIQAQRDVLHLNRERLLEAQQVIKKQNEKLKDYTLDLEKKVQQKAQELLETSKDLETFTYRASHDLKGPLATLEGLCGAALLDVQEESAIQYFVMLRDTIRKMKGILEGLIKVMEIREEEVELQRVNIRILIQEILGDIRVIENFDDIKISFQFLKAQILRTDRELLKIAIHNLIKNAIDYRKIVGSEKEKPIINIFFDKQEKFWELKIIDNGIGVHEVAIPNLFSMFYKGTKESKGHGLGLYITRLAIRKLGGDIIYQKDSLEGTCFVMTIPIV